MPNPDTAAAPNPGLPEKINTSLPARKEDRILIPEKRYDSPDKESVLTGVWVEANMIWERREAHTIDDAFRQVVKFEDLRESLVAEEAFCRQYSREVDKGFARNIIHNFARKIFGASDALRDADRFKRLALIAWKLEYPQHSNNPVTAAELAGISEYVQGEASYYSSLEFQYERERNTAIDKGGTGNGELGPIYQARGYTRVYNTLSQKLKAHQQGLDSKVDNK